MKKLISFITIILAFNAADSFAWGGGGLKSSKNAEDATYDVQFLDTMIAHHKQQIEMAEIAKEKSQNESVRNKADKIIALKQGEVAKLKEVREDIAADSDEAINLDFKGMHAVDMKSLEKQSSKNFDEKFIKESLKHNEGGLTMSKDAAKKAKNGKVVDIANMLTTSQVGEISELKEILKEQF